MPREPACPGPVCLHWPIVYCVSLPLFVCTVRHRKFFGVHLSSTALYEGFERSVERQKVSNYLLSF